MMITGAAMSAAVFRDYTVFLWLLKLGGALNCYFLLDTSLFVGVANARIVWAARILFAVSAYRCFFPVRYEGNVVFHDSIFSSILATRVLATFAEIAYIFQLSQVLRLLNTHHVQWMIALSWLMVAQVVISEGFVWAAILTEEFALYYYEELGWAFIFAANTVASAYLYMNGSGASNGSILLRLNLLFGVVYLPWQMIHLTALRANARRSTRRTEARSASISMRLAAGLKRAARVKTKRSDADSWGGLIGLTWMTAYWATLIPIWVHYIVEVLCSH